jgi:hypothetical protein
MTESEQIIAQVTAQLEYEKLSAEVQLSTHPDENLCQSCQ